jgi:hypothetical protein
VGVFGDWKPVDRSTPLRGDTEDSIDFLLDSTSSRWGSAAGMASGTTATLCTPTTPIVTSGATTWAAVGAPLAGIQLEQAHSRLAAYVAVSTGDPALAKLAWEAFEGVGEWLVHRRDFTLRRADVPHVHNPIDEVPSVSTNDAAQYGLAAIQNLALIADLGLDETASAACPSTRE